MGDDFSISLRIGKEFEGSFDDLVSNAMHQLNIPENDRQIIECYMIASHGFFSKEETHD